MSSLEYSCIFCDDVRQEIKGKFSFIGVYINDIVITQKDDDTVSGLTKFFIVCTLKNLDKRKTHSILIKQTGSKDRSCDIDKKALEADEKKIFIFEVLNFIIPESGNLEVYLVSGKDKQKIGGLDLIVNKEKSS